MIKPHLSKIRIFGISSWHFHICGRVNWCNRNRWIWFRIPLIQQRYGLRRIVTNQAFFYFYYHIIIHITIIWGITLGTFELVKLLLSDEVLQADIDGFGGLFGMTNVLLRQFVVISHRPHLRHGDDEDWHKKGAPKGKEYHKDTSWDRSRWVVSIAIVDMVMSTK